MRSPIKLAIQRTAAGASTACALMLLFAISCGETLGSQDPVSLEVKIFGPHGSPFPQLDLRWKPGLHFVKTLVTWESCTYGDQVTCREVGRVALSDPKTSHHRLPDAVKYGGQYRVSVLGQDVCGHSTSFVSYVSVPRPMVSKGMHITGETPLYLVIGPVYSRNLTVSWSDLLTSVGGNDVDKPGGAGSGGPSNDHLSYSGVKGFRVTWRRVDGQVSHPGHESTVVSQHHIVRGLSPATRYEICVREHQVPSQPVTCDVVHTLEDVPGPPSPGTGSCSIEAHGTHWRCTVSWSPPPTPNGRISGYVVYWKDSEGYTLHEDRPPGAQCSSRGCVASSVLLFLPHEGCVAAITAKGTGWETCVPIHDAKSRLLAVFERKLFYVVAATLLIYALGPKMIGAFLRCCIRGLQRQIHDGKNHVV